MERYSKRPRILWPAVAAWRAVQFGIRRLVTSRLGVALQIRLARADDAEWRWETAPPAPAEKLCLFVTYAPDGQIPERAVRHARIWADEGYAVVFVIALDDLSTRPAIPFGHALCRENAGHDFAAWSRALREIPLEGTRLVATVNDSVFANGRLAEAIRRAEAMPDDVVGFTSNREYRWHIQSYAVLFKEPCIRSRAFAKFWTPRIGSRAHVIRTYEIALGGAMKSAGLSVETLFPTDSRFNPTVLNWPELVRQGFPYLKRSALPLHYDHWRPLIVEHGFDLRLVDAERPREAS